MHNLFNFRISVQQSFELDGAFLSDHDTPLSPHHETKEKVKENMWEMHFTENGRYVEGYFICGSEVYCVVIESVT